MHTTRLIFTVQFNIFYWCAKRNSKPTTHWGMQVTTKTLHTNAASREATAITDTELTTPPLVSATYCNEAGNCTTRKWTTILLRFYYSYATQVELTRETCFLMFHSYNKLALVEADVLFFDSDSEKRVKKVTVTYPTYTKIFQKYIKLTTKPMLRILTETFTIQITTLVRILLKCVVPTALRAY